MKRRDLVKVMQLMPGQSIEARPPLSLDAVLFTLHWAGFHPRALCRHPGPSGPPTPSAIHFPLKSSHSLTFLASIAA